MILRSVVKRLSSVLKRVKPSSSQNISDLVNFKNRGRILILDDEESVLEVLTKALERKGYLVDGITDGKGGVGRLSRARYDLVLCDFQLPGISGPELFKIIETKYPEYLSRFVITTGDIVSLDVRLFIYETGALFLKKPFDLSDLYAMVSTVIQQDASG